QGFQGAQGSRGFQGSQGTVGLQPINFDSAQRLRVSEPYTLLQIDLSYDLDPMNLETGFSGVGNAVTYNSNQRLADLSVVSGVGEAFAQTYMYAPYQPGKSHLIFVTFVFGAAATGVTKRVGYFETRNGIYFEQTATGLNIVQRSDVSGSVVNDVISQVNWNTDTMDGLGPSAIVFNPLAAQVLFIDLQYLGHGIVRVGLFIDGCIFIMHQFNNSNNLLVPYMGTATLPVQAVITGSVGSSASTLKFKSASVQTEGQGLREMPGIVNSTSLFRSDNQNHILSIRPKLLYKGKPNRCTLVIDEIRLAGEFGNFYIVLNPIQDPPFGGPLPISFFDINTNNSAFEISNSDYDIDTLPVNPNSILVASGVIDSVDATPIKFNYMYPITLNRAGAHRGFGTLGIFTDSGGFRPDAIASIRFREFR
ncbi:MAG: hypothetical protein WD512_20635, partial [Candidatus Paceibacterota bacterium]